MLRHQAALRLSDFEDYAFHDDSAEHPMVIVLRIVVEGRLNEGAFRDSLEESLDENPLLQSVVRSQWHGNTWDRIKTSELPLQIDRFTDDQLPMACPQKRLDLTKRPGVWFDLRVSPGRSVLIAYFHHACCDGMGAIRFIGDVFARYGQTTATTKDMRPELRHVDPEVLQLRGTRRMPGHCSDRRAPLWHTITEASRLFLRRSYRFVTRPDTPEPESNDSIRNVIHTRVLPRRILRQLKKFSASRGVTTNDLCMSVFVQSLADWSESDSAAHRDLFRILMPVSMRHPEHDSISAANIVSFCFHNIARHQTKDFEALLSIVHKKSQQMVNRNEGAAMLYGFALARKCPQGIRIAQRIQPDFATAVMTNVGEVRQLFNNRFPLKQGRAVAGDVVLHRIDGVAPVRKNTNLTMSCGTYGGELIVHISRNTQIFSESDALFFVNSIADRLVQLANSETTAVMEQNTGEQNAVEQNANQKNTTGDGLSSAAVNTPS